jgi:hypothetical protein
MTEHTNPDGSPFVGQHVVVRTFSAGVHLGELVSLHGKHALLRDARRLWTWRGAFTLSEVATKGVSKSGSRIAVALPMIELTEAIEIIPTTEEARASFEAVHE